MRRHNRGYVLRIAKGDGFTDDDEFVAVVTFTVEQDDCGLRAGEKLRLRQNYRAWDGRDFALGSCWEVLTGAVEDPGTIWLDPSDGELLEFDDDPGIFDLFVRDDS